MKCCFPTLRNYKGWVPSYPALRTMHRGCRFLPILQFKLKPTAKQQRHSIHCSETGTMTDATKHDVDTVEYVPEIKEEDKFQLTPEEKFPNVDARKVVMKLDMWIVPIATALYLMAFIDRGNIGNANIEGLSEDLKLVGNQYNIALTVFFIPYSALEVPSNMLLKRMTPKIWLPVIMILWGIVMTMMGLVKNYGQLVATRVLLGVFEAGLYPGIAFYLTTFYRRGEMQFRQSIFTSASAVAGAFSGLLAWAIAKMDGVGNLAGWRWIFILEGIVTVLVACVSFFLLANSPETAHYLTPEERAFVAYRLQHDNNSTFKHQTVAVHEESKAISMVFVKQVFTDPQLYFHIMMFMGIVCPLYGISLFLPTIVKSMGYSSAKAQLMTVPIYGVAAICSVTQAVLADKFGYRSPVVFSNYVICLMGYVIAMACDIRTNSGGVYAGMFFAAIGCYTVLPTLPTWHSNNLAGEYKRAVGMAAQVGIGNFGGAMSSNFYRKQDAPRYLLGHGLEIMFLGLALIAGTCAVIYYSRQNSKRQRDIQAGKYDNYTPEQLVAMGDKSPYFRYRL